MVLLIQLCAAESCLHQMSLKQSLLPQTEHSVALSFEAEEYPVFRSAESKNSARILCLSEYDRHSDLSKDARQ